jgi:hypothetical protein
MAKDQLPIPRKGREGNSQVVSSQPPQSTSPTENKLGNISGIKGLFKPYKGDLFGTNGNKSGGLLYLSRMNVEDDPKVKAKTQAEAKKRMVSVCKTGFLSFLC